MAIKDLLSSFGLWTLKKYFVILLNNRKKQIDVLVTKNFEWNIWKTLDIALLLLDVTSAATCYQCFRLN